MLYEELMMDSSTLLKYKLFKKLMFIGSESYPIAQLATEMGMNYQQTVIDLTEIDKDIKALAPKHDSILIGAGKVNCLNLSCTIDEYRYHLLKSSVPFQFVLYFLNENEPTIDDFCDRYYSSRSTVSRKIDTLKHHLKKFGLRFTYTEAGMTGDERLIRLSIFNMIWLGVRGIDWPFDISEVEAEKLVDQYADYFPLSRTYLGRWELKYFAAIFLLRVRKGYFVKYDKDYDFLMKDNEYYDFDRLNHFLDGQLTSRQNKAESSFIYFLAHFVPFYTLEDDPTLTQTIHDFSNRPNPVLPMVKEYLSFAKKHFFSEEPGVLDHPMILGNLINIGFGYYVIRHPFPTIQRLVTTPQQQRETSVQHLYQETTDFFIGLGAREEYRDFITEDTIPLIAQSFVDMLLPHFDKTKHSQKVLIGVALEHNYLLVKNLYQILADLRFTEGEPYNINRNDDYDLIISSSLILKNHYPDLPVFLWDHSADETQYIKLYQELRKLFVDKNSTSATA